jgi:Rps23 Pro-64 3,4-dihydroxylase Tpa1-like proline 4-hydroxylase
MNNQIKLRKISNILSKKILNSELNINFFKFPYKHLIIDQAIDNKIINACLKNFPKISDIKMWEFSNIKEIEIKARSKWNSEFDIPPALIDLVRILNSSIILEALSKKFNIKKLLPDPYFSGGGLNITQKGGLLDVHVDGNYHDASGLNRRINVLVYFNKRWKKSWGGEFGIYDKNGKKCLKKIAPIFNRLLAFDTHDYSFHGLPNPINFPKKNPRRSLILYYYTKDSRPKKQIRTINPHSALWVKKSIKDKKGNLHRNFK